MKKLASIAVIALIMAACGKSGQPVQDSAQLIARDSLQEALENQDSLLVLMNDISNGMNQIKDLEKILSTTPNISTESKDKRQQIKNDMAAIQQALQERRQRLDALEKKLKANQSQNATLQRSIETLKSQISDQENTIESLRTELASANIHIKHLTQNVDSLNMAVAVVTQAKQEAEEESVILNNELNLCYYAIGSKGELKDHKLIETGFLRKTKILPEDFEQSYFTTADKRTLNTINLHSDKAKVLTNQPADSYQITNDATGQKVLKITNPKRFWNQSNFLVIQVD